MTHLEPQHTLLDSVEQMLAPETRVNYPSNPSLTWTSSQSMDTPDWQAATCSLMIIGLAWFTKHGDIQDAMIMEDSLRYYRERLETHLGQLSAKQDWQVMVGDMR